MAKEQCPNCGQFKVSKGWSTRLTIVVFTLALCFVGYIVWPAATTFFNIIFFLSLIVQFFIPKDKEITMTCDNCKYEYIIKRED